MKYVIRYILAIPFSLMLLIWVMCDFAFLENNEQDSWQLLKDLWRGKL